MINLKTIENERHPLVIAHRGFRASFPENTLVAFEAAIEAKADMIELDVCLSSDRIPVVIHDLTLDRTTNGKGFVSDHKLSELKKLDAGSWFSPEFKGEFIPTLEESLEKIRGRIAVNIEIKPVSDEFSSFPDSIEIIVCKILEKLDMVDSVIISSFENSFFSRIQSWYLKNNKSITPRIAPLKARYLNGESILSLCKRERAYSFHTEESFVTPSIIKKLNKNGIRIFPYTVNDEERMKQLIEFGVDGIISDDPKKLWKVIYGFEK